MASATSLGEEASTPPPAFYCPISLELMTDPVTLSSGITYDRASIQSWLSSGHLTCPVTRQPLLPHPFFIPNHTLLRIIRSWCNAHSLRTDDSVVASNLRASTILQDGRIHIGHLCRDAVFKLGLSHLTDGNTVGTAAELIPQEQATPLLISLMSHYSADACQEDTLAERTCAEAIATVSILPLSSQNISCLSDPSVLHCLSHFLQSAHSHSRFNSACLLAKLISQHPSPKPFLRSLSPQFLANLTSSLAQFLKQSNPSTLLTQNILQSLCLLCKSSRTATLGLSEAPSSALVHTAMEQLLHSARLGSTPISDKALSLLEILSTCAEGRAAIASHAFAVPTIAKFLQRSASEAAMEAAVVVLWKLCRYASQEKVRRQAMAACVPSKLVLLMQASQCSTRAKAKAGALVRLLIGEAKRRPLHPFPNL